MNQVDFLRPEYVGKCCFSFICCIYFNMYNNVLCQPVVSLGDKYMLLFMIKMSNK